MRAFVRASATPYDAAVTQVGEPVPQPDEVVVEVAACGLCGSDLHAVKADPGFEFVKVPVVLGHEFSGTVVASRADDLAPGDRVVAISIQGCGRCPTCIAGDTHLCPRRQLLGLHRDGGLAERVVLHRRHVVPVPPGLDLSTAALAEPLAVAVHAVRDRTTVRPGDRVVVSGPGPIGLFCARVAALSGGEVLVLGTAADEAQRLPLARRFGLRTATAFDGPPPDVWIEASGAVAALDAAVRGVRAGGAVTAVAHATRPLELVVPDAVRRELTLHFSYASRYPDYVVALDLLASGAVDGPALATTYPLDAALDALRDAEAQRVVKPLVLP